MDDALYPISEKGINPKEIPPAFFIGIPKVIWPNAKSAVLSLAEPLLSLVILPYMLPSKIVLSIAEYEAGFEMFKVGIPPRYLTPVEIPPIARCCGVRSSRIWPKPNWEYGECEVVVCADAGRERKTSP